MSYEVTLPVSGKTAVLREADELGFGDREDALKLLDIDIEGQIVQLHGGKLMVDFQRALFVLGVESWTAVDRQTGDTLALPSEDPDVVRRLTSRDGAYLYDKLESLKGELFPDFDVAPEPSPTGPSGD